MTEPAPSRRSCIPTRGSSPRPSVSSGGREPASRLRERSGTATTPNSSPLALWTVMIRTPSWPSAAVAACASPSVSAREARKSSSPRRSRPWRDSNSVASRISLRRLAKRASPAGRISTARSYPVSPIAASIRPASGSRGPRSRRRPIVSANRLSSCRSGAGICSSRSGASSSGSPRPAARSIAGQTRRRLPAAARSSHRVSGESPQAGEARAPNRAWSSSGLAIVASRAQTSETCCWDQ